MKNNYLKVLLYSTVFLIVLLIHQLLMHFVIHFDESFRPIYIFTFLVCVISLLLIAISNSLFHSQLGFIFLLVVTLKLIAAGIFINRFEAIDLIEYKISFIVLYLISIVLITIFTARFLLYPEK